MRKVIESTLISVDGVIGDPHIWTGEHFGQEATARALEQLRHTDAMLMGRHTYELFSRMWAAPTDEYAAAIHHLPKYVFSSTLREASWHNTTVVNGDVAGTVRALKQRDGQDILVYGHGPVGAELLAEGLLDELRLWIHPVVVGSGRPFFVDGVRAELATADVQTTATGVVIVTFHPARR